MSKSTETAASIVPTFDALSLPTHVSPAATFLQRLGKRLFLRALGQVQHGELTLLVPATGERHIFGRTGAECDLRVTLEVLHPQTFADAAFGGTVGARASPTSAASGARTISPRWCACS